MGIAGAGTRRDQRHPQSLARSRLDDGHSPKEFQRGDPSIGSRSECWTIALQVSIPLRGREVPPQLRGVASRSVARRVALNAPRPSIKKSFSPR
jgi:hypothetical protein